MSVSYKVMGLDGVHRMLKAYTNPEFTKRMKSAVKAGGNELKGPMKSESAKASRRMGRAVSVVQSPTGLVGKIKRTRDPHVYVGYRRKTAFFAHFVVGGTQDHGPKTAPLMTFRAKGTRGWATATTSGGVVRTKHVRGVKANPIPSRVAQRHESSVYRAIDRDLDRTEPK